MQARASPGPLVPYESKDAMTATAKDRLDAVTAELKRRGVVDVKLTLSPEAKNHPFEEVAGQVASFLEAYLRGEAKPVYFIDAELPPGVDERQLEDLASSEFETAMAGGVSRDNFERLAKTVAAKVVQAHARQHQAFMPLLGRVLEASVGPQEPSLTPEVIQALLHARRHAQQPCDDTSDSAALERASNALLGSVNAAWRSLGLKPSVSENDAQAFLAGVATEAATKT